MSSDDPEGHSINGNKGYPYDKLAPENTFASTDLAAYETFEALVKSGMNEVKACCFAYNMRLEEAQQVIAVYRMYKKLDRIIQIRIMTSVIERIQTVPTTSKSR